MKKVEKTWPIIYRNDTGF